jgi:general secretion pathway protein K
MAEMRGLLGERSSYFLMRAEAQVAERRMRLYSVLERRNRRVTAVARASGSL